MRAARNQHPWLDELNAEQRRAATHSGSPLLILAGAGTGKTTTLCARVAWLLAQGLAADRVVLLSFTRRAAREMVERARTLAERAVPGCGRIVGGTFHSLAHRTVRMHAAALGLSPGFGVLDAGDAADLLDLVREERARAITAKRFPRAPTMLDIYSRTVNSQTPLAAVLAEYFPWCEQHRDALGEIFRAYGARKRELQLLDLDDLLVHWRALVADEVIGAQLAGEIDHLLIDEYQDVNGLQVDIVAGLRAGHDGVTVVGDDFQAIYGFRAASARHILGFPERFPGTAIVTLERNYRSTAPILAVANAVSAQDHLGFAKELWTEHDGGNKPELLFALDDAEQGREVCERVLAAREEAIDLRRQAVLFRTGHDSDLLELELTRRSIPFVKYGGLRYLDAAHVKDLVALMRIVDNPADEVSWFRVLQLLDGVGPARARRILAMLQPTAGEDPPRARFPDASAQIPEGSRTHFRALIEALTADGAQSTATQVERLVGALAPLTRLRYADGAARVMDFDQLVAAARGATSLREFVSELVLDPPASSADLAGPPHLDEDYLILSTVHSAKGLEWEVVHLIGAYDGNFPSDMSTGSDEGVAEERRLIYVALTRARRRLHVYVPFRYYHRPRAADDHHGYGKASRFLTDAVQRLFVVAHTRQGTATMSAPTPPQRRIEVSLDALF
jgi:DNA helicase-2/ATP-dependent DNA helicase PcrA